VKGVASGICRDVHWSNNQKGKKDCNVTQKSNRWTTVKRLNIMDYVMEIHVMMD